MKRVSTIILCLFLGLTLKAQSPNGVNAKLNHMALSVVNLGESTKFYRDIIGLDTIPEPFRDGRHAWFSVGPLIHLHLIADAKEKRVHPRNTHICFTVDSVEDFVTRLKKDGLTFTDRDGVKGKITVRVDGVKQIYLNDPDGYWVEINDARW